MFNDTTRTNRNKTTTNRKTKWSNITKSAYLLMVSINNTPSRFTSANWGRGVDVFTNGLRLMIENMDSFLQQGFN
uniref:Uncharacterized protein n=1 Tax=Arion vulgaris TaxID=1028688 RepID=A0A0B7BGR7_9EUPU